MIDNVPRTDRGAEQKMQLERRLAWVFLQSGKFKLAVRLYENVVEETDKQTGGEVIYEFAEALEGAGEYEKAIVQWQMLARGLTRQSEKWLMANYRFINCYYLSGNNEQAKKQKDYFMVKYRHGLSDEWRKQFESLGEVER